MGGHRDTTSNKKCMARKHKSKQDQKPKCCPSKRHESSSTSSRRPESSSTDYRRRSESSETQYIIKNKNGGCDDDYRRGYGRGCGDEYLAYPRGFGCGPCAPICDPCQPGGLYPVNCGPCAPCGPCISFAVQSVTSVLQVGGRYLHSYTILFSIQSGRYFASGFCGICVNISAACSGNYQRNNLFRCGCDETVIYTYSSASATPANICATYDECGCCVEICGTQTPPVTPCSITGMLFESNPQLDGTTTINVMLTNTGTTIITGATFDIPQPVNTSAYVAGVNFTEVNLPGGTVMRFGPIDIPVGNTPVTGSFTVLQEAVGSYEWSAPVTATSCDPALTLSLTTTRA